MLEFSHCKIDREQGTLELWEQIDTVLKQTERTFELWKQIDTFWKQTEQTGNIVICTVETN